MCIRDRITAYPVEDALISISYTGVPENTLEEVRTDRSGMTESVELSTPPLEYSLDPENVIQPYSEYTLNISAPGFEPVSIAGTELLPEVTALQNIRLRPVVPETQEQVFVIPAHTLYGEYPPKIAEDEIKPCLLYTSREDDKINAQPSQRAGSDPCRTCEPACTR